MANGTAHDGSDEPMETAVLLNSLIIWSTVLLCCALLLALMLASFAIAMASIWNQIELEDALEAAP